MTCVEAHRVARRRSAAPAGTSSVSRGPRPRSAAGWSRRRCARRPRARPARLRSSILPRVMRETSSRSSTSRTMCSTCRSIISRDALGRGIVARSSGAGCAASCGSAPAGCAARARAIARNSSLRRSASRSAASVCLRSVMSIDRARRRAAAARPARVEQRHADTADRSSPSVAIEHVLAALDRRARARREQARCIGRSRGRRPRRRRAVRKCAIASPSASPTTGSAPATFAGARLRRRLPR